MLRVLVLLLLPLVILAYDEKKKCNVFLGGVKITWVKPFAEKGWTKNGLENLHDAYTIIISDDDIPILCTDIFANFPRLSNLTLNSNKITQIEPGAFSKIDRLYVLDLNENHLEEIKEGVFNFLTVKTLYLEKNFIETIHPNAFDDMPRLENLYLSDNRIRSIKSDWFKNTPGIVGLSLPQNKITTIQAYAFKNMKDGHMYESINMDKFLVIDLSDNKIKFVHPQAFDNLQEIGILGLRRNQIENLSENLLSTITLLYHLLLDGNQIECFPKNLENLMKAHNVNVKSNPWNCSCAEAVQNWADENNRTVYFSEGQCKL